MTLLKTFTMKWWQTGLFKWGLLALGIAIGAYWPVFFGSYLPLLVIVAVLCLGYITYLWWTQ